MHNEAIRNHYAAFTNMAAFGLKYSGSFPPSGRARVLFTAMAALPLEMEERGVGQLTGSIEYHSGTTNKRQHAEELRDCLRKLRGTAKTIGLEEGQPTFANAYRVPKSRAYEVLLTQVRTALAAARPHEARFIEFELPEGFLDRMETLLGLVGRADESQGAGRSSQVGGTAGMAALVDRGMVLREKLSPLVRNRFELESAVWAEWLSASRVIRAHRVRRKERSAQESPPVG